MKKTFSDLEEIPSPLLRLIDANLNRLREGIRVVEDIRRYCFNDEKHAKLLKEIRHKTKLNNYTKFLHARDIQNDVLKISIDSEKNREDIEAIQIANIKRAEESARVLEESFKLFNVELSEKFKKIRYDLYDIEKTIFAI